MRHGNGVTVYFCSSQFDSGQHVRLPGFDGVVYNSGQCRRSDTSAAQPLADNENVVATSLRLADPVSDQRG